MKIKWIYSRGAIQYKDKCGAYVASLGLDGHITIWRQHGKFDLDINFMKDLTSYKVSVKLKRLKSAKDIAEIILNDAFIQ